MAIGLETLTRSEELSLLEETQEEVSAPQFDTEEPWLKPVEPKHRNRIINPEFITMIGLYLDEVSKIPRVSQPEIVGLKLQMEMGQEEARNHLVEANLQLVISIAKRFKKYGMPLEDLIQEGNLGLIRAAQKYDWKKGYTFSTYAVNWIRASLLLAIVEKTKTIRIPVKTLRKITRIREEENRLYQKNGSTPTTDQLSRETGLGKVVIARYRFYGSIKVTPLEATVTATKRGGRLRTLEDVIADPHEPVEEAVLNSLTSETLKRALKSLTQKQQYVLKRRFLDPSDPTFQDIGKELGLTRGAIFDMEKRALKKMRKALRSYNCSDEV